MTSATMANDGQPLSKRQKLWSWLADSLTQQQRFSDYFEPLMQMLQPNWSSVSYRAQVLTVRSESDDVFSLVIRPKQSGFRRRWASFRAGQHVELSVEKDGVRTSRTFSISSSPDYFRKTGLIELTIRVQEQGAITPWLKQHFAQGGLANISSAYGDFVLSSADEEKPLLMIAGGSGITPFRSMLLEMQAMNSQREVHLLYYARNGEEFLFPQEFLRIQKEMPDVRISLMDSSQTGFIQSEHLSRCDFEFSDPQLQVMICGPTPMIKAARDVVANAGVTPEQIFFEYFGAAPIDQIEAVEGKQTISCERSDIQLQHDGDNPQSLLTMAEQAGLKPVSGCRIGVCHQCICKKQSGVVYNTKTERYSDTGNEDIQLCVSVAVTDLALDL